MDQKTLIPVSILLAGLLVAGAVFYSNKQPSTVGQGTANVDTNGEVLIEVSPIDENDWVQGNRDAQIALIEFSDTECPFCKRLHETMNEIVTEYDDSEVAWAYRHLPLTQLHSKAGVEALALECAGELGGNDGFWDYTNQLYAETPSNNGLDLTRLPEIAEENGLDRTTFESCLESDRHQERIQEDVDDATRSAAHLGGRVGTPYTVLVSQTELNADALTVLGEIATQYNRPGQTIVTVSDDNMRATLSGALPKEMWTTILDAALGKVQS